MRKLVYIISLSLLSYTLIAQTLPTDGVPIDGGLSILLAAGVGYGAKKMYDSQKDK
jgi:hypothetical protein